MNIQEIDKWLDNEYGISYTRLGELNNNIIEYNIKYKEEIKKLKQAIKDTKENADEIIVEQSKEIEKLNNIIDKQDKDITALSNGNRKLKEEKDKEIEKLKNGIYKILKLNEYMIHCESKKVIDKFLMKQWRTIYETLGIPEPSLARCSKNNLLKEVDKE